MWIEHVPFAMALAQGECLVSSSVHRANALAQDVVLGVHAEHTAELHGSIEEGVGAAHGSSVCGGGFVVTDVVYQPKPPF